MTVHGLDRHIDITPGIAGGKPRIAGHRITVHDIAVWHVQMGKTVVEICAEYDLELAAVHAALAYYYDHREEIDRKLVADEELVERLRRSTPSALEQRLKDLRSE